MEKKSTDNLKQDLMDMADLDKFLEENQEEFSNEIFLNLLKDLLEKKKISKAALAKKEGMSEVYLHQIFAGKRRPSRNRLLCLCYGLGTSVEEAQDMLRQCGMAQLYPKMKRDAIIWYGLAHQVELFDINDKLYTEDLETLF